MKTESPNKETQDEKEKKDYHGIYREYGPFLSLGFQLAAAVVVFFFLGNWVDKHYGIEPAGKLTGLLIGCVGGFIKFFKSVESLTVDKEKQISKKKK